MDFPFPLERVGDCIDNTLFVYAPDNLAKHNFNAVVQSFGFDLSYDIALPLNPIAILYPVFCPVSGTQLGTVLLAQYASPQMRIAGQNGFVTHTSLARLQTVADLQRRQHMAELPRFQGADARSLAMNSSSYFSTTNGFFNSLPLVHLTVGPGCVKLSGDWISHALHDSVPMLVENLKWLYHSDLEEKLARAITQYKRFWVVISRSSPEVAVPTLDIRMVWSAHLSNFRQYADFSILKTRAVVVPAAAGAQTTSSLYRTAKKFSELFGCSYCQCKCKYCSRVDAKGGRFAASQGQPFSCARYIYELLLPTIVEREGL